jgi:hypothetical protein
MAAVSEQGIRFQDEQEREIFAVAKLGEDVRVFLTQHPVGRYLHHRAKMMVAQAQIDALEVDPDGWSWLRARSKLRKIRQQRDVAQAFIDWLADAIVNGDQAARDLEEYRQ